MDLSGSVFAALRDLQEEHSRSQALVLSLNGSNSEMRDRVTAADAAIASKAAEIVRANASMRAAAYEAGMDEAACHSLAASLQTLDDIASSAAAVDTAVLASAIATWQPARILPDGYFARAISNARALSADEEDVIRIARFATDALTVRQQTAMASAHIAVTRDEAAAAAAAVTLAEAQRARVIATAAAAEAVIEFRQVTAHVALAEEALIVAQRERAAASFELRESLRIARQTKLYD